MLKVVTKEVFMVYRITHIFTNLILMVNKTKMAIKISTVSIETLKTVHFL